MAYLTLVNSIVGVWPGYEIFFYHALYTKLCFCISPNGSYMFLTPKHKIRIYAEAIGAVGALERFWREFFMAEGMRRRRRIKMEAKKNNWTGYET